MPACICSWTMPNRYSYTFLLVSGTPCFPLSSVGDILIKKLGIIPLPRLGSESFLHPYKNLHFLNLYCHDYLGSLFPIRPVLFLVFHVLHTVSQLVLMVFYHIIFFFDVVIKYLDKNILKGKPIAVAQAWQQKQEAD